ncbi:MAG TPA: hypothetical protein VHS99_10020, partial [Chloroflexota bacterium]|nr:hypothetical protein [Chloroflexota bacterium]
MTGDAADRCTEPGAVTPEAMLAFVDGVASAEVVEHLRQCPECASEASALARLVGRLKGSLGRFNCPSPQLLGEYELGFVTPEARTEIARHVVDCPRCNDELHTLRSFLAGDPTADLAHAPREGLVARVRRVVATLFVPPVGTAGAALR